MCRGKVKGNVPTKERLLWRSTELIIRLFVSIQLESNDKHLWLSICCSLRCNRKFRVFQVSQENSRNWHKRHPPEAGRIICKWLLWWATCEFIKLYIIAAATVTNWTWTGWLLSAETYSESLLEKVTMKFNPKSGINQIREFKWEKNWCFQEDGQLRHWIKTSKWNYFN